MIPQESHDLITRANKLRVLSAPTRKDAAELWDFIRTARKQAEGRKEEVCRPLKTAWDEAKKPFDAFVKECTEAEGKLQKVMGDWDREQDRLARIEQAKIQAKIDAENAKKLAKAEAKGQDVSEVVLKVAPVVQAPPKAIETQAGTTQQRIEKTVYGIKGVVADETVRANHSAVAALLAQQPALFTFDWVAFRKLASTGMLDAVSGVEKRTEYVYSQRSK